MKIVITTTVVTENTKLIFTVYDKIVATVFAIRLDLYNTLQDTKGNCVSFYCYIIISDNV